MLNVGGLMQYPRGSGGIVLCNLLFKEAEEVPANVDARSGPSWRRSCATCKAPFTGGKTSSPART